MWSQSQTHSLTVSVNNKFQTRFLLLLWVRATGGHGHMVLPTSRLGPGCVLREALVWSQSKQMAGRMGGRTGGRADGRAGRPTGRQRFRSNQPEPPIGRAGGGSAEINLSCPSECTNSHSNLLWTAIPLGHKCSHRHCDAISPQEERPKRAVIGATP